MNNTPCALVGLRGKGYYAALRSHLEIVGQPIIDDAILMKPLTVLDVGKLSVKHRLNFRATCEWLEESKMLPTGTYDRMTDRGIKATVVYTAVEELKK